MFMGFTSYTSSPPAACLPWQPSSPWHPLPLTTLLNPLSLPAGTPSIQLTTLQGTPASAASASQNGCMGGDCSGVLQPHPPLSPRQHYRTLTTYPYPLAPKPPAHQLARYASVSCSGVRIAACVATARAVASVRYADCINSILLMTACCTSTSLHFESACCHSARRSMVRDAAVRRHQSPKYPRTACCGPNNAWGGSGGMSRV